tara:strand:- start:1616 stop:1843 length:228 start_codon:yes stop_codon:yes gene_type:complete
MKRKQKVSQKKILSAFVGNERKIEKLKDMVGFLTNQLNSTQQVFAHFIEMTGNRKKLEQYLEKIEKDAKKANNSK